MEKDFLKEIVENKIEEVREAKKHISQNMLKETAKTQKNRSCFFERLKSPGKNGINIIAEIKKASPSKGIIREDLDVALYASYYESGEASAISVLTDNKYFKGSVSDLKTAKGCTNLPILRKDFIISSYQIYESKVIGADAILLIVRILSKEQLKDYISLCIELELDALVEVYSKEDVEIASLAGARLIGINNRNLKSFDTNIETAINILPLLSKNQIAIAASGINNRKDIEKIASSGIFNFLIGESLVRSQNPSDFLKELYGTK
ncbi:MAG: indole-3-glycerol phosphate synthase TrpC [Desulfobacterales bacterium]|nr:indole-3-glycerol phosphate synthase TrpC [Desulfobacterales bacterium]